MVLKRKLLMFIVALAMVNSLPGLGQSGDREYDIHPEWQGIITPAKFDSILSKVASYPKTDSHINYDSLGSFMWLGNTGLISLPNDSNKVMQTDISLL